MNRRLAALRPNKADKALAMIRATVYVVFMAAALAAAVSDATQSTARGLEVARPECKGLEAQCNSPE